MKAKLEFELPDEACDHQDAVDGTKWKSVVRSLDQELRRRSKHGTPLSVEDIREILHDEISGVGLDLFD